MISLGLSEETLVKAPATEGTAYLRKAPSANSNARYSEFDRINGEHSFKSAVPGGNVEYQVRTRHGGRVVFFNFPLAKEMGLIPQDHPDTMNERLERKLLETFSLVIINEYDISTQDQISGRRTSAPSVHGHALPAAAAPDKQGKTSGDGRGIWNGEVQGPRRNTLGRHELPAPAPLA